MKLITDIVMYRHWDRDKNGKAHAESLLEEIKTFAKMNNNAAFWTDGVSSKSTHCVVVRGMFGSMENATYIKNAELEDEIREWCRELADWCHDDPDEDIDDEEGIDSDFAHKILRVEIKDNDMEGGMTIVCFNHDGELDHELHVLPLKGEY